MGYQTIIAINHDRLPRDDQAEEFGMHILQAIRSGSEVRSGPAKRVVTNHHTEKLTIEVDGRSFHVKRE